MECSIIQSLNSRTPHSDRTAVLHGVAAVLLEELDDVRLAVRHLLLDLVLHLRMRVNAC